MTNFRCDELQPSETKTQAKLSGISPENPAGFLRAQCYVIVNLLRHVGCFDLPQTQKERHVVRMEAARLWRGALREEALREDTKNGCVGH